MRFERRPANAALLYLNHKKKNHVERYGHIKFNYLVHFVGYLLQKASYLLHFVSYLLQKVSYLLQKSQLLTE